MFSNQKMPLLIFKMTLPFDFKLLLEKDITIEHVKRYTTSEWQPIKANFE